MQKEKVRVYVLARELQMESKDLLELCRQAGLDVKNQLSSLDADQREAVEQLIHRHQPGGSGGTATAVATAPARAEAALAAPPAPPLAQPTTPPPVIPARPPDLGGRMRDLNPPAPQRPPNLQTPRAPGGPLSPAAAGGPMQRRREIPRPRPGMAIPGLTAHPKPKAPLPAQPEKKPLEPAAQKPLMRLTPDMLKQGPGSIKEVAKDLAKGLSSPVVEAAPPVDDEDEEGGAGKVRPGVVKGRDERHKKRSQRAKDRRTEEETLLKTGTYAEEGDRAARLRQRVRQPTPKRGTQPRKGRLQVELPITVRSFSEATGIAAKDLLRKLMERGHLLNINAAVDAALAEELGLEFGVELDIRKPLDPEEQLLAKLAGEDRPDDLVLRAPIVTIMGHVDHGKTSLLDRIRESNVVATEAGGITQHLRAWRVDHNGKPVTFLDTPGHEAFTQMRARGANVTDIVVLVVAADDGVMPQTEEAISHAKAAGVPIVVAINKVDLPNANLNKTRSQLYSHELIPDTMGGETPFVETVSTKDRAKGIDELLEMLALVAELKELRANPKNPGRGTCLEAKLSEGEGVVATLLVRNGTLRKGDVVVCGATFGRVRAMYNDLGRPLDEAGPSIPVRITGLDIVPNADDPFQVVPDLVIAREIAEKRAERRRAAATTRNATFRLEDLNKAKVAEVKLILKVDVRGSIEAIHKEMQKLAHAEVRVKILHDGIGAISESDVQLALASPEDTLIVGFNVVPDDRARSLADEKGVEIREYDIIYKLTDDIRAALEGKLKPREEVIHLGRAVVRDTFKISRVGTIAGCYVTQGVIERSARIRLIREGVVVFPPADRNATIDSLRRIKDDVKEVREGYECGIKLAGFDDIKVNDVIEAYRVEQVQRTL